MFGFGRKIRDAAATGGIFALAGAIALVGLVWFSVAGYLLLCTVVPPAGAAAIIGAVALLPGLVVLLRQRSQSDSEPEPIAASIDPDASALVKLAQGATALADRSPILGAALTLGAAYVASRSPVTSALAVHMLADAVERWTKNAGAETPAEHRQDA